jgi:hypothetical protein
MTVGQVLFGCNRHSINPSNVEDFGMLFRLMR